MKIAIVADPFWPIPPQKYGGTERVIDYLIQGLIELGHQVTLFASGNSKTSAKLIPTVPQNINSDMPDVSFGDIQQAIQNTQDLIFAHQKEFDVISWHAGIYPVIKKLTTPVFITLHNPYPTYIQNNTQAIEILEKIPCISPSEKYRENWPKIHYLATIPHGLPVDEYSVTKNKQPALLFLGRFSPDKNPHLALQAAIDSNIPLFIAAKKEKQFEEYFDTQCKDLLNHPIVHYEGEIDNTQKQNLLKKCSVNLHPLSFIETFGLTVVEAGLSGIPTISFNKGSLPELIRNGVNGFVVDSYQELVEKIPQALKLDPEIVRESFLKYDYKTMAKGYEEVFGGN